MLTVARLTSSRMEIKRETGTTAAATTTTSHRSETFSCQKVVHQSSQLDKQLPASIYLLVLAKDEGGEEEEETSSS